MRTPVDDIPVLVAGEEVRLAVEMLLGKLLLGGGSSGGGGGRSSNRKGVELQVQTTSDRGAFTGTLKVEPHELLAPLCLSDEEFTATSKLLGGFNQNSATVALLKLPSEISKLVLMRLNVFCVQSSSTSAAAVAADSFLLKFSGILRWDDGVQDRFLLTITKCDVKVQCDNVLMSSVVCDLLKKYLTLP